MKYVTIFTLCVLCISCATMGSNIPDSHEDICRGITNKDSGKRERAILYCKDKHVLFDVAKYDEDPNVRITATKRLMDIKMVIALYKYVKTDETLSKSQKKKFRTYLKKKFELLKKCPGVGYTDVEKRKKAIDKCNSNLLKAYVAKYDFDDEVRLFAAGNITSIEKLKSLWLYIQSDKTLSVKMKKRIRQRCIGRAKAIANMKRRPSAEPAPSRQNDHKFDRATRDSVAQTGREGYSVPLDIEIPDPTKDRPVKKKKRRMFGDYEADIIIARANRKIKECYERVLKKYPSVKGKVRIRVVVNRNGKVSGVHFKENEPGMISMTMCIKKGIERMTFKEVSSQGSVEWPISLIPGN